MMQPNKDTPLGSPALPGSSISNLRANSYLGPGLRIKGEISGNEDLTLDSDVEGLISIGGFKLMVGPSAHLKADVVAREAVISGEVTGEIRARDRIEIRKSASIVGDLSTCNITIEEGAYFNGNVEIDINKARVGTDLDSLLSNAKKPGQQ